MGRRDRSLLIGLLLAVGISGVVLSGCSNVVTPPTTAPEPLEVFLLDHGRHASLALPGENGMVRWAYGDWRWFVLGEKKPWNATRALFWPTLAGLGREVLPGVADVESLRAALLVPVEDSFTIPVAGEAVDALARRLEELFRAQADVPVENPDNGLGFVRHPEAYAMWNNSNQLVARWLRELGCEVHLNDLFSRWRVQGKE